MLRTGESHLGGMAMVLILGVPSADLRVASPEHVGASCESPQVSFPSTFLY